MKKDRQKSGLRVATYKRAVRRVSASVRPEYKGSYEQDFWQPQMGFFVISIACSS